MHGDLIDLTIEDSVQSAMPWVDGDFIDLTIEDDMLA